MDNDDAAAATIAAVAAAAAASHQAQEQEQLNQQHGPSNDREGADGQADTQRTHGDTNEQSTAAAAEDGDRQEDAASERLRREAEEAAQQAVVAAAAAHHAHQEKQQQQEREAAANASNAATNGEQGQSSAGEPSSSTNGDQSAESSGSQSRPAQSATAQGSGGTSTKASRTRSAPSPNGGQPKRRKINTCLQCKARKVKCDKARPLCGPCRKHGVTGVCTWADEESGNAWPTAEFAQPGQGQQNQTPNQPSWPAQAAFASSFANGSGSSLVSDPQAMVERIVQLEAQVAQQRANNGDANQFYDGSNNSFQHNASANLESFLNAAQGDRSSSSEDATQTASQQLAAWSTQFANVSEAERGMAADALAMIAQHNPHNNRSTLGALASGTSNLLSGIRFPFSIRPTPETLRDAVNLLPTDENIDYLLNHILSPLFMTGSCHCASPRLVSIQFARFQQQREAGDIASVDVSFLALLFLLLVLATDFADVADILARNIVEKEDSIAGLIELWLSTGEALLSMADFTGSPSLNCLMALTAARHFYISQGRKVQHATTLSLAISLAQALGLHRLGSAREDEARWLAEDAEGNKNGTSAITAKSVALNEFDSQSEHVVREALTSGGSKYATFKLGADWQLPDRSHLVRETGRKLWYYLVSQDWVANAQVNHVYHCVPGQWNTAYPLNLDDEELPDGTGENPYRLPPEKPPGSPSDSVVWPYFYEVTKVCVDIADANSWGKRPSYDEILTFDSKWRKAVDDLPVYLRLDGHSEMLDYVRDQENHRPYLATIRFTLLESINHRLIVLHRGFLIRGHHDSRYEYSVKAAVDAARMVIFCRQSVMRSVNPIQKFWHFRQHAFNAAMLLSMHLLELARKGIRNTEETTRLRDEIAVALTMIDDDKRTNAFPSGDVDAYSTAKQIIARLVSEVDLLVSRHEDAKENNSAESLEGLYTHAGDTSEDASVSTGLPAQHGSNFSTNAPAALSEAQDIDAGLNQLLNALMADNHQPSVQHPQQQQQDSVTSSPDSDVDGLWRMIDSYARPSFI